MTVARRSINDYWMIRARQGKRLEPADTLRLHRKAVAWLLGQRWPRLISIGLVSEDGLSSFYAELPVESYREKITPWVQANVLPLLEGGACVMQPAELRQRLAEWIGTQAEVVIASDSLEYDFKFLRAVLDPWPGNVDDHLLLLTRNGLNKYDAFEEAVEAAFTSGLRRHHALDDAKANRLGWIAAGSRIGKVAL